MPGFFAFMDRFVRRCAIHAFVLSDDLLCPTCKAESRADLWEVPGTCPVWESYDLERERIVGWGTRDHVCLLDPELATGPVEVRVEDAQGEVKRTDVSFARFRSRDWPTMVSPA